jgi:hypothetical protein
MRYLKKFNESVEGELQKFCDTYLAYLIDEGFSVEVTDFSNQEVYEKITIWQPAKDYTGTVYSNFSWDEIKDDFISFLQMLREKYYFETLVIQDFIKRTHRVYVLDDDKELDIDKLENYSVYVYPEPKEQITKIEIIVKL